MEFFLRKVVAELQFGIIEEADQLFPNDKSVSAGLAGSATGQHRLVHVDDVGADFHRAAAEPSRGAEHGVRRGPSFRSALEHQSRTTRLSVQLRVWTLHPAY